MAEDKSEQPTQHKLKEAQNQGQVAKSLDLNFFFSILSIIAIFYVFVPDASVQLKKHVVQLFVLAPNFVFDSNQLISLFNRLFWDIAMIVLPIILAVALFNILFSLLQTGVVFSTSPLKPDFKRINPVEGFKKIFSKKTLFELFKNSLKVSVFALVWYVMLTSVFEDSLKLFNVNPKFISFSLLGFICSLLLVFAFAFLPIVLLDFAFSRWEFKQKMMMSKQDVKDEYKKREGSPDIKSKQKKTQKELLKKTAALANVKSADIVITNPTHIAIALQYQPKKMVSPKVIAIGEGSFALKIRMLAKRHRVPIVRNIKLARSMIDVCQIDGFVEPQFYKDLGPIYQWLYKKNPKKRPKGV